MTKSFYSNGKLLLTGEYAVLDGALSLAVPTKYGQSLSVETADSHELLWTSMNENGRVWFESTFDISSLEHDPSRQKSQEGNAIGEKLSKILREARKLNPNFLSDNKGYTVRTDLNFPRNWGLGSSSTLINNIAQWAKIDAYQLLWNSFSGSGYDIACAQNNYPILYSLKDGKPAVNKVDFNPPFRDRLYFIHLNKKQNSRDGISAYRKKDFDKAKFVRQLSNITRKTLTCNTLSEFESLMTKHEALLSRTLHMPTVKESLFPDFRGTLKSLGAWGGDFILATGDYEVLPYFQKKGYKTIVAYAAMVL
ncbi:Mevalonate kinase [Pricia antarctica]|uniref:Mevalonate kinase n=1 Tax=Pricia antarctica TaxID=641691 RepID=A0A1G6VVR9_9FLAO|nr:GYDIA family GHMP kinase [Pricia antarctica]SDD57689.1 Mevalonate kinase [Pricia antarctica]